MSLSTSIAFIASNKTFLPKITAYQDYSDSLGHQSKEYVKMKTVVFANNSAWSLFNFRKGIIRALRDRGYRVIAITPFNAKYVDQLISEGCEHIAMDSWRG